MPKATPKISAGTRPLITRPIVEPLLVTLFNLGTILKRDRAEDQRQQHQQHGPVETTERCRIDSGPCGKDGTTGSDQPHLVAIPVGGNGVDNNATLGIGFADIGQQACCTQIVTIGDGKADQHNADQRPPDKLENLRKRLTIPLWLSPSVRAHGGIANALLLKMVTTSLQAAWSHSGVFHHQVDLDHGKDAVEDSEPGDTHVEIGDSQAGGGQPGWQYATNGPWLTTILSDKPACFRGDPWQRQTEQNQPEEATAGVLFTTGGQVEGAEQRPAA